MRPKNADSFQDYDTMGNIFNNVGNIHIDIECLQETHNDRKGCVRIGNYTLYFDGGKLRF